MQGGIVHGRKIKRHEEDLKPYLPVFKGPSQQGQRVHEQLQVKEKHIK